MDQQLLPLLDEIPRVANFYMKNKLYVDKLVEKGALAVWSQEAENDKLRLLTSSKIRQLQDDLSEAEQNRHKVKGVEAES